MSHISRISSYLMSHLTHIYSFISSHVSRVSSFLLSHVSHVFVHSEFCAPETAVLNRPTDISWVKGLHGVISQKTGNFNTRNISVRQLTVNRYYSRIIKNRPTAYRDNLHFVLTN